MRLSFFNLFASTLETIPARAILRAFDLECRMLEEDLLNDRPVSTEETNSVLTFYGFVVALREGTPMAPIACRIPPNHLDLYCGTIDRLVAARELPPDARERFEDAFPGYFKTQETAATKS